MTPTADIKTEVKMEVDSPQSGGGGGNPNNHNNRGPKRKRGKVKIKIEIFHKKGFEVSYKIQASTLTNLSVHCAMHDVYMCAAHDNQ